MKLTWDVEAQTQLKPSLMDASEGVSPHFSSILTTRINWKGDFIFSQSALRRLLASSEERHSLITLDSDIFLFLPYYTFKHSLVSSFNPTEIHELPI